jgi:hypothetical protein
LIHLVLPIVLPLLPVRLPVFAIPLSLVLPVFAVSLCSIAPRLSLPLQLVPSPVEVRVAVAALGTLSISGSFPGRKLRRTASPATSALEAARRSRSTSGESFAAEAAAA